MGQELQNTRSVARLLAPVNLHIAVAVVVLATLGVVGTVLTGRTVDRLIEETTPAAAANAAAQRDMLVLQSATQAWVQSGQSVVLTPYRIGEARLEANIERLGAYARPGSQLDILLSRQEEAIARWRALSQELISQPGGLGTYDGHDVADAESRFEEFERAHAATTAAFQHQVEAAHSRARAQLSGTLVAMLVVGVAALAILRRTRRRLQRAIELPLRNLEEVAHRLADNDTAVRAEPVGPREVQAVAQALNDLAAAHERALAVEERLTADQKALDSARNDFVSNVSHELRTPLSTLTGYLEMVHDEFGERLSPRHQKMMDAGQRNVARLRSLIEDLLTLSRSETNAPVREIVDGREVVTEVIDDLRVIAAQRNIRIAMYAELHEVPWVVGDRSQLFRALLNVVGNAVKFSHPGGLVEVDLHRHEDWLTIRITDHGLGIPEGEIEKLGSRFFRGSNAISHQIGGTGLGLRITQSIIDAHGGEIQIRSKQGIGTTVTIGLGVVSASTAAATEADSTATSVAACASSNRFSSNVVPRTG